MKHLSDEDIARLIDGKIGKKEREDFLKHISDCDDCMTIYTETLKFIESEKKETGTAIHPNFLEMLSRIKESVIAIFPVKRWALVPVSATLLIALLLIILPFILKKPARDDSAWWLKRYGDYAAADAGKDPRVKQAFAIYERVSNAADKTGGARPRLAIINNRDKAYALALRDNCVGITPLILDICYKGNDSEEGDRRLAFILGHELAHLGDKDFHTMETAFAFQDYGQQQARGQFLKDTGHPGGDKNKADYFKEKEFEADKRGVIYARIAGYDVRKLFTGSNDFFKHWSKLTGIEYEKDHVLHPAPGKRVRLIREELAKLADDAELFHAGVLLFVSGVYTDALAVFQAFAEIYPAREVYNNIGAAYLHLAMAKIFSDFGEDYFRFRLAVIIDYSTTAEIGRTRSGGDYSTDSDISRYLTMAEENFIKAARRDALDDACRLNLSAAYIWRQEYTKALEICDAVLARNPDDTRALNNKAIALYHQAREKNSSEAVKLLEKAMSMKPVHYEALYNLAIIAAESGQESQAKNLWEQYLHLKRAPRDQFYRFVYEKINGETPPRPVIKTDFPKIPHHINTGDNVTDTRETLGQEPIKIYEAEIGGETLKIKLQVLTGKNLRIIVLDDVVSIVEQDFTRPEDSSALQTNFGHPQNVIHHAGGDFYIYSTGNPGFTAREIAGRVCAYIWF